MSPKLIFNLSYVSILMIATLIITMVFSYLFALTTDEHHNGKHMGITGWNFYISCSWKNDKSRTVATFGIPIVAFFMLTLISARFLQLKAVFGRSSALLKLSLVTGIIACLGLVGASAVTLKQNKRLHLIIAGICFMSAYVCQVALHSIESLLSKKDQGEVNASHKVFYMRRFLAVIAFFCGVVMTCSTAFANSSGSVHDATKPQTHLRWWFAGSLAEVILTICFMMSITSFGFDLKSLQYELTLAPTSGSHSKPSADLVADPNV